MKIHVENVKQDDVDSFKETEVVLSKETEVENKKDRPKRIKTRPARFCEPEQTKPKVVQKIHKKHKKTVNMLVNSNVPIVNVNSQRNQI